MTAQAAPTGWKLPVLKLRTPATTRAIVPTPRTHPTSAERVSSATKPALAFTRSAVRGNSSPTFGSNRIHVSRSSPIGSDDEAGTGYSLEPWRGCSRAWMRLGRRGYTSSLHVLLVVGANRGAAGPDTSNRGTARRTDPRSAFALDGSPEGIKRDSSKALRQSRHNMTVSSECKQILMTKT